MSSLTDQERKIFKHLKSLLDLVHDDSNPFDENGELIPEIDCQIEFNTKMKDKIVDALDILGARIGRRSISKEFGINVGS